MIFTKGCPVHSATFTPAKYCPDYSTAPVPLYNTTFIPCCFRVNPTGNDFFELSLCTVHATSLSGKAQLRTSLQGSRGTALLPRHCCSSVISVTARVHNFDSNSLKYYNLLYHPTVLSLHSTLGHPALFQGFSAASTALRRPKYVAPRLH